jgi:hypothetical protein
MANLSNLTQAQLDKLIQRPNWLSANTAISGSIAGRVFASKEGWMLSPTKVHPEGKQMPAECVMAIPNLSEYIEYDEGGPVTAAASAFSGAEAVASNFVFKSVSVTRRSRSRYIVNIALDETVEVTNGNMNWNFAAPPSSAMTLNPSGANLNTIPSFNIAEGETVGRIQMDLQFDIPIEALSITLSNWSSIVSVSGPYTAQDQQGNPYSPLGAIEIDAAFAAIEDGPRWNSVTKTMTVVP